MPLTGFRFPFRTYQSMVLARQEADSSHKLHIVTPCGSGKMVTGLELVRRLGQPAVIFTPTVTIQEQWRENAAKFVDDPSYLDGLVSLDPNRIAEINIFTYQLISTPGEAQEWVQKLAQERWQDDLLEEGQVANIAAAKARLETLQRNNPGAYRDELARRYKKAKAILLHGAGDNLINRLHPGANQLIQHLLACGVSTVVLDEGHNLPDYWAVVLDSLISQIHAPHVIGLSATRPNPDDEADFENYTSLLGEVDFEVPAAAAVKEGDLAPYRDLVYFVEPSGRETSYLTSNQRVFEETAAQVTSSPSFRNWLRRMVWERPDRSGRPMAWDEYLNEQPLFSLASLRCLRRFELTLPIDLPLPRESEDNPTLEDWAILLERYGLEVLKGSTDPADQRTLMKLRKALLPYGFTIIERGLPQHFSPGDLVLAYSESKDAAVIDILRAEYQALGKSLRALVITDFERLSNGTGRLDGVIDNDAGSAMRLFKRLANDPGVQPLHPALVTDTTLVVEASQSEALLSYFNGYLASQKQNAACSQVDRPKSPFVEIHGEGEEWSQNSLIGMVSSAFDHGQIQLLLATSRLPSEGWDAISLNTLINLASFSRSTTVEQLRSRALCLDPLQPHKVAHFWDIICVAPLLPKGDYDLKLFTMRQERYWGLAPLNRFDLIPGENAQFMVPNQPRAKDMKAKGAPGYSNAVVKGVAHISSQLAFELAVRGFQQVDYKYYTGLMLDEVNLRQEDYTRWNIGKPYSDAVFSAMRIDPGDLKIRTVARVQETLKAMLQSFAATLLACIAGGFWIGQQSIQPGSGENTQNFAVLVSVLLGAGIMAVILFHMRRSWKLAKAILVEQPPDQIFFDIGKALLRALQQVDLVSHNLQPERVRTVKQGDNSVLVWLDTASPKESAVFIQVFRQVFAPLRDQSYLVLRDDRRLPSSLLQPFWFAIRGLFSRKSILKQAYRPLPDVFAINKERAEAFTRAWSQYVGGDQLVYTRRGNGRSILVQARTQRRPEIRGLVLEIWR